jgi:hypothetical protein
MGNRNGLLVDISVAQADGYAEREEALAMVRRTRGRQKVTIRTLGMDAGYDAGPFLHTVEHAEQVVPHMPPRAGRIVGQDQAADARRRAHGGSGTSATRSRSAPGSGWRRPSAG